jgi:2-iminoacetate synthase
MKTFYDYYNTLDFELIEKTTKEDSPDKVLDILKKEKITYTDFLYLISPSSDPHLDKMADMAKNITEKHFGKVIQLYIPLYLSNVCRNGCTYCGFNSKHKTERRTLSCEEIENELLKIKELKYQQVLLLTGDAPDVVGDDYICKAIKLSKKYFPLVSLEVYQAEKESYKKFSEAGALGLTIYQETYHRGTYDKVHLHGRKKDFVNRLNAPDRALSAGMRKAGIGALLGLYDYKFDAAIMGAHASYLMKKYWRSEISISFPRIRKATGNYLPEYIISDKELVKLILALRIFLPRVGITISTRESAHFRDNMIGLGITMMSAGSKTNPGGYGKIKSDEQFSIVDDRSVEDILQAIKKRGYQPVFKDWDNQFARSETL